MENDYLVEVFICILKCKITACFVDVLRDIDSLADDYMKNVKTLAADTRKEQLGKIQKLFSKTREYGDDKVQLAMQTYEMVSYAHGELFLSNLSCGNCAWVLYHLQLQVDKHIRRLDADLARFEAELKEKTLSVGQ